MHRNSASNGQYITVQVQAMVSDGKLFSSIYLQCLPFNVPLDHFQSPTGGAVLPTEFLVADVGPMTLAVVNYLVVNS